MLKTQTAAGEKSDKNNKRTDGPPLSTDLDEDWQESTFLLSFRASILNLSQADISRRIKHSRGRDRDLFHYS